MGYSTQLTSGGGPIWISVSYEGISAQGKVAPMLRLLLGLRTPVDSMEAEIHRLVVALSFGNERIGVMELPPTSVRPGETTVAADFPLTPRTLSFIGDHILKDDLSFKVDMSGLLRVRRTAEGQAMIRPEWPVGEWGFAMIRHAELGFSVPRSEWFSKVVAPISDATFVSLEVEIPSGSDAARLAAAFEHLREAERCYEIGDDPGVFTRCRGAVEALPGYPSGIVERIENPRKRTAANKLVLEAGNFLHAGRHVSQQGSDAGTFPVDHRDAALALNMTRLLLAYLARL